MQGQAADQETCDKSYWCALNIKCLSQAHVLNPCFLDIGVVLPDSGNTKRQGLAKGSRSLWGIPEAVCGDVLCWNK